MKTSKKNTATNYCAGILKVLADETRLEVVKQLLVKPRQVNELNKNLPVSQSLLSHHLKILRDAGLVDGKRQGKAVVYELVPKLTQSEKKRAINLGCCQLAFLTGRG